MHAGEGQILGKLFPTRRTRLVDDTLYVCPDCGFKSHDAQQVAYHCANTGHIIDHQQALARNPDIRRARIVRALVALALAGALAVAYFVTFSMDDFYLALDSVF